MKTRFWVRAGLRRRWRGVRLHLELEQVKVVQVLHGQRARGQGGQRERRGRHGWSSERWKDGFLRESELAVSDRGASRPILFFASLHSTAGPLVSRVRVLLMSSDGRLLPAQPVNSA